MRKKNKSWTGLPQRARSSKSAAGRVAVKTRPLLQLVEKQIEPAMAAPDPLRLLSLLTSEQRKQYPMASGLLDYFPDALAAVAHISYLGNQKHNPGQDLHWARGKSMDHDDCEMRHLVERGAKDSAGVMHSAQKAWRALAGLQEELEKVHGLSLPRAARIIS